MSEIGLMSPPGAGVTCRGCGKHFTRKEWSAHKPDCIKCESCGHSVVERAVGCECCESAP